MGRPSGNDAGVVSQRPAENRARGSFQTLQAHRLQVARPSVVPGAAPVEVAARCTVSPAVSGRGGGRPSAAFHGGPHRAYTSRAGLVTSPNPSPFGCHVEARRPMTV